MPIERLNELEALGEVGRSAPSHYSYVGYTLRPEALLQHSRTLSPVFAKTRWMR